MHANDDVNMGQSSNDVFPSAVHLAALDTATHELLPALERLEAALTVKADQFHDVVKSGRTHLMDAVPVTLARSSPATPRRCGSARDASPTHCPRWRRSRWAVPPPDRAEHPSEFPARVRAHLIEGSGLEIRAPEDPFEAQGSRDALVELSGA